MVVEGMAWVSCGKAIWMTQRSAKSEPESSACRRFDTLPSGVRLENDRAVRPGTDALARAIRYGRAVNWVERQLDRIRAVNPLILDGALAVFFFVLGVASVFGQDIYDDSGAVREGLKEPNALIVLTALVVCAPVAVRRRWPLAALVVSSLAILVHIGADWPEGTLPTAVLFLTYTVGAWCSTAAQRRRARFRRRDRRRPRSH